MAVAQELTWKISVNAAQAKAALADVRSEVSKTSQSTQAANKSELSMRQQLSAASSLQRQRSAALIAEWKKAETSAANLAKGVQPVSLNLQKITDVMQTLGASSTTLAGPMNGISSRLRAMASIAAETGGGLGIAAAGIAAVVVAAAGAVVVITELNQKAFEAAQAWSNYGQEIYKAKLITGQTAEQLSVLKIIASETDTSFDTLTRTAAKLQVSISKGITEPSDDAGKALKLLRLNTEDFKKATPDQQLQRTAKALNEVTNQGDKNRASMALLGKGYAESSEALHDLGERYAETEERARALGLLMSEEDVAAAHAFDDAMDEVKTGMIALTVQIGQRTGPVIIDTLNDIAHSLGLNQSSWKEWGRLIGDVLAATVTGTVRAARDIQAAISLIPLATLGGPLGTVEALREVLATDSEQARKQLEILRGGGQEQVGGTLTAGFLNRPTAGSFPGGKESKGAKKPRSTELQDSLKDAALAEREVRIQIDADIAENKRALEREGRNIEEFTKRAIELADQRLNAVIERVNAEQASLDEAFRKKLIKQKEYEIKTRELTIETREAVQQNEQELSRLEHDRDAKLAEAQLAALRRRLQLVEDADQAIIDQIKRRVDLELKAESEGKQKIGNAESEGERKIAQVVAEAFDRRRKALEEELSLYGVTLERRAAINDELIRLDGERANAAVQASQRIADALKKEADARHDLIFGPARDAIGGAASAAAKAGGWQGSGQIEQLNPFIEGLRGQLLPALRQAADGTIKFQGIAAGAFNAVGAVVNGLAQGVGNLVQQWVLMGDAGPDAMRKMVASVLAGVAAQAATLAIMELAMAAATLFPAIVPTALYGTPAQHLKAAALFGVIATGAALAGRAVAGNSFQQDAGSASGRSVSSGGRGGGSLGSEVPVASIDRRVSGSQRPANQAPVVVHLVLEHKPGRMFDTHIVKSVVRDHGLNGAIRDLIVREIKTQE